jgi:hypothetical protein
MTTTTASAGLHAGPYPVTLGLEMPLENRNRLTTALRPVLAIPHSLLVGPAAWVHRFGTAGFLGSAAYLLAIVNWFSILVTGEDLKGIRELQLYYLRWRARAVAYMGLLVDDYPPFGDAPYPVSVDVTTPAEPRDRATIAVRLILAVPHLVALFFVLFAWFVTTVIAWLAIVFTGAYPATFAHFGAGALRWLLRVEAYLLLLTDEYPPFALD